MQSCNYHKDVLEVFLVYILCFSIGYDSFGEGLLVDSSEEDPLDLLFIQGTSTDPLFIATCVLDPANDEGGDGVWHVNQSSLQHYPISSRGSGA